MIRRKTKSKLKDVCFAIIMKQSNSSDADSFDQAISAHKKDLTNIFLTMCKEDNICESIIRDVYSQLDTSVTAFRNILYHGKD